MVLLEGVSAAERPACSFLEFSEGCTVRESTTVEDADPKVEDRCREIKYVNPPWTVMLCSLRDEANHPRVWICKSKWRNNS